MKIFLKYSLLFTYLDVSKIFTILWDNSTFKAQTIFKIYFLEPIFDRSVSLFYTLTVVT